MIHNMVVLTEGSCFKCDLSDNCPYLDVAETQGFNRLSQELNKIANDLRIEYNDFIQIEQDPSQSIIEDNLKSQIRSIFDILDKHGVIIR